VGGSVGVVGSPILNWFPWGLEGLLGGVDVKKPWGGSTQTVRLDALSPRDGGQLTITCDWGQATVYKQKASGSLPL